jgi:thrombospondin type 3 repeat protein/VCBS repeat protein
MNRLTRGGLPALALPTLCSAILLLVPSPGFAALLTLRPGSIDHPLHIIAADFNQDGYDDLVVANFEAGTVTVLINQKDGTFALQKDSPNIVGAATVGQPTVGPLFLATGDINTEDVDGDRVNNDVDNCPNVFNPIDGTGVQPDADANGVGDACETTSTPIDSDQDGWSDFLDNCPFIPNPGQEPETAAGLDGLCGTADDNLFLIPAGAQCSLQQTTTKVGAACSRSNDLIIVNSSSGAGSTLGLVRVRVNDATGGLINRFSQQASSGASQAVLADFNGDRRLDAVVSNTGSDALLYYPGAVGGDMGVVCLGGANAGKSCVSGADCPGGTCQQTTVLLTGGFCSGGALNGMTCATSANCTGGGTCRLSIVPGLGATCSGGSDPGKTCTKDQDCPGGGICRSPAGPEGLATADFDGDTHPDLVFANRTAGNVGILLNGGTAAFFPAPGSPFAVPGQPVDVLAGSLNGDPCADLVVLEHGSLTCQGGTSPGAACFTDTDCPGGGVCRVPGNHGLIKTFTTTCPGGPLPLVPKQTIDLGSGHVPRGGALVDFDGDNNLDLAVADFSGGQVLIYSGSGAGTFVLSATLTGLASPSALASLDYDHDSRADLAVLGFADNSITLYRNTGSPGSLSFALAPTSPVSPWKGIAAMALFPADASEGQDVVMLNTTPPRIDVLSGTGTTFRGLPPEPLSGPVRATGMTVADLLQDGISDLLVLDDAAAGTVTPLITDMTGVQTERLTLAAGNGPVSAAVGPLTLHGIDYDQDGVPDAIDDCPTRYNPPNCPANDKVNFPECFVENACTDPAKAPVDITCATKDPVTSQCDSDDNGVGDQCQILDSACQNIDTDFDLVPDYDQFSVPPKLDN